MVQLAGQTISRHVVDLNVICSYTFKLRLQRFWPRAIGETAREVRSNSSHYDPCNDYTNCSLMLLIQYIIPKPSGWL
jgi:hypothetical protein